jgi:hypothetical protein
MKRSSFLLLLLLSIASAVYAQNSTPWLPAKKTLNVSLGYVLDRAKSYRAGTVDGRLPVNLDQNSFFANLEYGLHPKVSLDFATGYTGTKLGEYALDGVADTLIGFRVKAYSNERSIVTVRVAGLIPGSYPLTTISVFAPGFKGSGVLTSGLYGRTLPKGGFASVELGYTAYQKPVADNVFGSVLLGQSLRHWSYWGGYQQSRSLSGIDIFGRDFTPFRYNQSKRIYGGIDTGGGYTTRKGLYFGGTYGHYLHGRNIKKKTALALTIGFQIPALR